MQHPGGIDRAAKAARARACCTDAMALPEVAAFPVRGTPRRPGPRHGRRVLEGRGVPGVENQVNPEAGQLRAKARPIPWRPR